jgi:hypothetical protein
MLYLEELPLAAPPRPPLPPRPAVAFPLAGLASVYLVVSIYRIVETYLANALDKAFLQLIF